MTLDTLKNALNGTGYPFRHYGWSSPPADNYGVYAEDSGADLTGNNQHIESGTQGTIDFYTRDDTTAPREAIEAALNGLKISWRLNSIQYETDTGFIHYEWLFGFYG